MHVEFTPEQRQLQQQLRDYYQELFTPDLRQAFDEEMENDCGGPVFKEIVQRMGKDGWLGIGWPEEYGGRGATPIEQFIFWDETYKARAPQHIIPVNTIGPAIMDNGTDVQKKELLPKILSGDLFVAVGYTEPSAGTDLASLTTRAVRDGDEWVINGQKIYTTFAHISDYVWLAARTDPDAKKHAGISIIMVPTNAEGFTCTRIDTLGRERTNATYYQDVRVPVSNTVGPINGGWGLITSQLNHERIALAIPGQCQVMMEEVWQYAADTPCPSGGRMLDQQWVQIHLAKIYAKLRALQVLNWRSAWSMTEGTPNMAEASALKVMGGEFFIEAYNLMLEITGAAGIVMDGQPGCLFGGRLETAYRAATTYTFGGGVNEVQRDIIAGAGLTMPRGRARK